MTFTEGVSVRTSFVSFVATVGCPLTFATECRGSERMANVANVATVGGSNCGDKSLSTKSRLSGGVDFVDSVVSVLLPPHRS